MNRIILSISFILFSVVAFSQTNGTLTVTATTSKTTSPKYNPKNIVAFWIEDSNGAFVKTMLAYAGERRQYLKTWRTKTTAAGSAYNTVDAITGATQSAHAARTATWNGKNRSSVLVADGTYKLKMEVTDNDGTAQNLVEFSFIKGETEQLITPATSNGFSAITIKWTPVNTAVDEVDEDSPYQLYPTIAVNTISVTGANINSIEIFDINGKLIFNTTNTVISVSNLPKGVYFASISATDGSHIRRFMKK